jgi:hypothetical protein
MALDLSIAIYVQKVHIKVLLVQPSVNPVRLVLTITNPELLTACSVLSIHLQQTKDQLHALLAHLDRQLCLWDL